MSLVDSGNHWEVVNGFIRDEKQLHHAGKQALRLAACSDSELVQPFEDTSSRLQVKKVAVDRLRGLAQTEHFSELLHIFDRARQVIGSDTDVAYINVFDSYASTGEHRDRIGEETLAVGLSGQAIARVQDPVDGGWREFRLDPGDATHFDNNQSPEGQRPLHMIRNDLAVQRVSLVINR